MSNVAAAQQTATKAEPLDRDDPMLKWIADMIDEQDGGLTQRAAALLCDRISNALGRAGHEVDVALLDKNQMTPASQTTLTSKSRPKHWGSPKPWARIVDTITLGKKGGHAVGGDYASPRSLNRPEFVKQHAGKILVSRDEEGVYKITKCHDDGTLFVACAAEDWKVCEAYFLSNHPELVVSE